MKKFFGPVLSAGWIAGLVPDRVFSLGKKTPWYRRSWIMTARWIPAVLAAPLLGFLIWKGISKQRTNE